MLPDPDTCYRALSARDPRFDGVFFVGVRTTRIYCRPVCPARLPGRDRCRFFSSPGAAESAGFRPCLRCRPERAPGRSIVDSRRGLAERAEARIRAGGLNGRSVDELARELHVGSRQLRRALKRECGLPPVALAQTYRLLLAKRLLAETELPVSEVAFAAGFSSLRRFNALIRDRWRLTPTQLRRRGGSGLTTGEGEGEGSVPRPAAVHPAATVSLTLDYRPPYEWNALLDFLAVRAVPGLEIVEGRGAEARYLRTLRVDGHRGWVSVAPSPDTPNALEAQVSLSLLPVLMEVLDRLRSLFDLDAEPEVVDSHLTRDPKLAPLVRRRPGLRVPGAADPFEVAWRAVLGQQVSVAAARTLAGRVVAAFGSTVAPAEGMPSGLSQEPVDPGALAAATEAELVGLGLTGARARCLRALAAGVAEGTIQLSPGVDVAETTGELLQIPGIGPWTAGYIGLRALHWPDAWPVNDLVLRRALGDPSPSELRRSAEGWRPWRGYATLHLWNSLNDRSDP